ncbi:MAG: hypothetical protein H6656_18290 [Ardenticatenaceae bacterium]|nr:hypothetical protein [Ardenticatenaceae bacterium]
MAWHQDALLKIGRLSCSIGKTKASQPELKMSGAALRPDRPAQPKGGKRCLVITRWVFGEMVASPLPPQ